MSWKDNIRPDVIVAFGGLAITCAINYGIMSKTLDNHESRLGHLESQMTAIQEIREHLAHIDERLNFLLPPKYHNDAER